MPDRPPPRDPDAREEMNATPPFFTWRTIYTIVLGGLAAQIVLYAVLTAFFRDP